MIFTLEALQAQQGDCLILHYGDADDPRFILIDGGPTKSGYQKVIKKRLDALKEEWYPADDEQLPLEMMMVSHIDDDHVDGLLALTGELIELNDAQVPSPYVIRTLWFNSFDEILGNKRYELFSGLAASVQAAGVNAKLPGVDRSDPYSAAVIANVPQGRRLRNNANLLEVSLNSGTGGLIIAADKPVEPLDWGDGLKLTVLAPSTARVAALHDAWEKDLRKHPSEETLAQAAAFSDNSVANLSSIVVLAEAEGKQMLLTGDARGDDIVAGLKAAELLDNGKFHVDILKLPHHGSDRNVAPSFFETVTADHYVISANGMHHNPDIATLEMIVAARADDNFTLHFTNRSGKQGLKERLDEFLTKKEQNGRAYRVNCRKEDELSLKLDLLDAVTY